MQKPYILFVDDEKIVLDSLKGDLKDTFGSEFIIEVAESGEEAIEIVKSILDNNRELPLVISDYIMPEMKGDELLSIIRELKPETYRIMLTGMATIEGVTNAINKAGLYRFISKPWEPSDLNITISEALKSFNREKQIEKQNNEIQQQSAEIRKKNDEITEINKNLEKLVEIRTADLEEKKQEIIDSINYAKRIQLSIMGDVKKLNEIYPLTSILYLPKDIVSGDFYWFAKVENKIIIIAADCTGHGVPGAFMSVIGISALNQIVREKKITKPNEILDELRTLIINLLWQTGNYGESKDGMDIAVIVLNTDDDILEYSGAYNPLYLIRKDALKLETTNFSNFELFREHLIVIKGDRMPIGFSTNMNIPFSCHTIRLEDEDVMYIGTDGYTDQFGGPKNNKFLPLRLKSAFVEYRKMDIYDQVSKLKEDFFEWKGKEEQVDDILLIGVKFKKEELIKASYKLIISYQGETSSPVISKITDTVEEYLLENEINKVLRKRINTVLIEILQNCYNYYTSFETDKFDKEFSISVTLENDLFCIETTNNILNSNIYNLKEKLDFVHSKSKEEIKEFYKSQLSSGQMPQKSSAGLGFYYIASKCDSNLIYKIFEIDEDHSKFSLKVTFKNQ
ncbi:MAG: SiaB family protein kinase [Candidatus Kapabacteria bacterium]|nr:SiaB family protein kinase [Candidatus Kapabacteria bacterium]